MEASGGSGVGSSIGAGFFAAFKYFKGRSQIKKAEQLRLQHPRPTQSTPHWIHDNTAMARNMAGETGLPGQGVTEDKMDASISGATSDLMRASNDPSAIAAGIVALNENKLAVQSNMAVNAADYKLKNTGTLMNQYNTEAKYDMENWDWNQKMPYIDAMAAASAYENAGERNMGSAINDMGGIMGSKGSGGGDMNQTGASGGNDSSRPTGRNAENTSTDMDTNRIGNIQNGWDNENSGNSMGQGTNTDSNAFGNRTAQGINTVDSGQNKKQMDVNYGKMLQRYPSMSRDYFDRTYGMYQ